MPLPRILNEGPLSFAHYAFNGSIQVDQYDLMYHEADDVRPASSASDQGSESANQTYFAQRFAGIAATSKLSTDPADTNFPVIPDAIVEITCASGTWEVGDMLAVDEASGGTALEDAVVVKTTDPEKAIGYCVKREASAVTTVRARLMSRVTPPFINPHAPKAIACEIAFGDFTDGGSTSGYVDLDKDLPAGALVKGWKAEVHTGFTGDTTAVMQVGVSGDVDRFSSVTTNSCLAAGTVGAQVADDSNAYCAAATTPRVTVTGGADFTSVAAGSMTVTIFYEELN